MRPPRETESSSGMVAFSYVMPLKWWKKMYYSFDKEGDGSETILARGVYSKYCV